jgi:2-enoate reductase
MEAQVMKLFERGRIGRMETKNRIAMAPMGTNGLTDIDYGYSRRLIDFYAARAKGGASMIITGSAVVNTALEGGITHFLPRLDSPAYIGRLSEFSDAMHHYGARLVLQLTQGFGRVNFVQNNPIQPISASVLPCFLDPSVMTRELTIEEIESLVTSSATAAGMAKVAGVDAIEIHGYGGYLLDQFQTALWNKRTDKYGGDLEGRMRFSMETIAATRAAVGEEFPIIFKFTPDHYIEGGREIEEGLEIVKLLENAGVDALHVDGGCYEVWNRVIPSMYEPPASQIPLSEAVKKVVSIPVIAHGKLGDPELAEKVIAEGKADFVALGRPLLADPEWANKVKNGKLDDIRPCIGCNEACIARGYDMKYLSCSVNPVTGMEKEYALTPVEKKKSVLVIGAGPGGLEAARVAASRGCEVTLWEKTDQLGGKLILAAIPDFKRDIEPLTAYLSTQIEKAGVKVELMKEATPELVQQLNPDVVIISTGSLFRLPNVPGTQADKVFSIVDLFREKREAGETVIVVGGGLCGCETAAYLARKGKQVTIIEMKDQLIPEGVNINTMMGIQALLAQSKVEVLLNTKLVEITNESAVVETNGDKKELEADSIVMATGFTWDPTLRDRLEGKVPELFTIGDCAEPRNIEGAIWDGFHAARII